MPEMPLFGSLGGLIVLLISIAVFQATTNQVEDADYAKFQGTWRIVSVECGGKTDDQDIGKYTIIFNETTMIVRECEDDDQAAVKYELGDTQGSKRITFAGISGIYQFTDDNLLICYSISGDRPVELRTTTDRPEEVLMILKRIGQR
jgi:uncharacterized protein (TIGR03067 family)